ncbi:MAG: hypothetical protein ABI770_06340 [Sphingomicrobium sp.]
MRPIALFACLALAETATSRPALPTLNPAQAISRAAASAKPVRALFQFRVARAAKSRDGLYLDSEKDFRSPANLGIVIRTSAMPGLTQKFGANLQAAFLGRTLKLIGRVSHRSVGGKAGAAAAIATEIEVTHAGQILSVT